MDRAQYLDDRPSIEVVLADGDTVSLVPVRAEDASLLVEGLTYMSPHSRYMRFLSVSTISPHRRSATSPTSTR